MTDKITYEELNLMPEIEDFLKPHLVDENLEDVTEQLAEEVKEILLNVVRIKEGVDRGDQEAGVLDEVTKAKMLEWDTDHPEFLLAEKVLKRIATDRGMEGLRLVEQALSLRAKAFSKRQGELGRRRPKACPLDSEIESALRREERLGWKEFLNRLERTVPNGTIEDIDQENNEIVLRNRRKPISYSGVEYRFKRIRKKLKKP